MLELIKRNPLAAVMAVLMHVAIIAFMLVGVDWLERPKPVRPNVQVVQARVVDQSLIDAEVVKLKQAEDKKKAEADAVRRKEEQRLQELKQKQEQEKKRLAELEKQREAEENKRQQDEVKRKADAKKKAEAEKKRAEDEAKKKAEAEKKRKAEEAKKKAEAEKKRKAEEARKKAEAEQKAREAELAAQLEAERLASEQDRYIALIAEKVERNWLRPTTVNECLQTLMRVRLIPGGGVASVTVTNSSGSGAFDRSAEQAIYKSDPLPVPTGAGFELFRDFNFLFDPCRNR